ADLDFAGNLLAPHEDLAHRGHEFSLPHRFHKFLALGASLPQFKDSLKRGITVEDPFVAAHHRHALDHAPEDSRRTIALIGKRVNGLSELRNGSTQGMGKVREIIMAVIAPQWSEIAGRSTVRESLEAPDAGSGRAQENK